jgi:hypothetical protein
MAQPGATEKGCREHGMQLIENNPASAALPPGFPAIEIEGEHGEDLLMRPSGPCSSNRITQWV